MSAFVIDVNVAIVANGASKQADTSCELACVRALRQVGENLISIDDGDHILSEYRRHLSMRGQPGVGDEFMHWIHQNQHTPTKCERVPIVDNQDRIFDEFPSDPDLCRFDADDRKYVAVALGSSHNPSILNAVDSDWRDYKGVLERHGLRIDELCPQCLKRS